MKHNSNEIPIVFHVDGSQIPHTLPKSQISYGDLYYVKKEGSNILLNGSPQEGFTPYAVQYISWGEEKIHLRLTSERKYDVDSVTNELRKLLFEGLFIENSMLTSKEDEDKVFLNPFDILDTSVKYLDYMQSTFDKLIQESEEEKEDPTYILLTKTLKQLSDSVFRPAMEEAKSHMNPENLNEAKNKVYEQVLEQIEKYSTTSSF